jgi:hypothetical protein
MIEFLCVRGGNRSGNRRETAASFHRRHDGWIVRALCVDGKSRSSSNNPSGVDGACSCDLCVWELCVQRRAVPDCCPFPCSDLRVERPPHPALRAG